MYVNAQTLPHEYLELPHLRRPEVKEHLYVSDYVSAKSGKIWGPELFFWGSESIDCWNLIMQSGIIQ